VLLAGAWDGTRGAGLVGNSEPDPGNSPSGAIRRIDTEDTRLYTVAMHIEWDPEKGKANLRAHAVGFPEAVTVLEDEFALTREDPEAAGEQRLVTLGMSSNGKLLVVVYRYREPDIIRLISAWKATRRQREQYEKGLR
jgi:hypothetical protein